MITIPIHEAGSKLSELIRRLKPGDEVIITDNNQPVAKLISQPPAVHQPRRPGSAKGKFVINVEDDEHLDDFKEYMP